MRLFATRNNSAPLRLLFLNHIDACGVTAIIVGLCLVLHRALRLDTLPLVVLMAFTCWFAFAVNDYCDASADADDPFKRERNFFVKTTVPRGTAWAGAALCSTLMLAGFAPYGMRGLLEWAVAVMAIFAYSAPPLRLKNRPLLDLAMHGFFVETAPYYATLYLLNVAWTPLDRVMLAIFFLGSLAAQIEQQTRDFDADERTSARWVGRAPAVLLLRILTFLFIVTVSGAFLVGVLPLWFVPFGVIGLPVVIHRFTRKENEPRSQRLIFAVLILELVYAGGVFGVALLTR